MEVPRTDQPLEDGESLKAIDAPKEDKNDPESIAKRVVDVFWESFHASREDDS